jgi:hypothetical protein
MHIVLDVVRRKWEVKIEAGVFRRSWANGRCLEYSPFGERTGFISFGEFGCLGSSVLGDVMLTANLRAARRTRNISSVKGNRVQGL